MTPVLDLYPTRILVKNLYCFRGEHSMPLEATVYAVIAQADDNPARSNWLGKSTLLLAFAYVLYGWHTKKTDDEIITTGETECHVGMILNDGAVIERTKARGKSEQLKFTAPGKKTITQAQAQKAIEQHIGVTKDNFFAMCFFEQKRIGALVTAKGAERSNIIEGWLAEELEPMQRLNDAASRNLKKVGAELAGYERELEELKSDWRKLQMELLGVEDPGVDIPATLEAKVKEATEKRDAKKKQLEAARKVATEDVVQARLWDEKAAKAEEYDTIVEQGITLRKEFDSLPKNAQAAYEKANTEASIAAKESAELQAVLIKLQRSDYAFDGQCPIACQECPSRAWVCEQATSPDALQVAKDAVDKATKRRQETSIALTKAKLPADRRSALDTRLTALRAKAEQLADIAAEVEASEVDWVAKSAASQEAAIKLEGELAGLIDTARTYQEDLDWARKAIARVWELETFVFHAKEKRALAVEAVQLTGRTGAQQAIQEIVMAKIERRANEILSTSGIPLQVDVSWEQETSGLAKVCPSCGTAFPTSQRVRTCESCGATRGPNIQSKLVIEPSNRSGAAEDLSGVSLGIAASQWLRAQRGARWSSVFIDEPFGSLDEHNRQALGSHIASMLRTAFSSAFVVAHERSVLNAMPARINIAAGPNGSRIEGTVT